MRMPIVTEFLLVRSPIQCAPPHHFCLISAPLLQDSRPPLPRVMLFQVSRLSVNFLDCVKTFKIVWKVIRLSEMFSDCPETFKVV